VIIGHVKHTMHFRKRSTVPGAPSRKPALRQLQDENTNPQVQQGDPVVVVADPMSAWNAIVVNKKMTESELANLKMVIAETACYHNCCAYSAPSNPAIQCLRDRVRFMSPLQVANLGGDDEKRQSLVRLEAHMAPGLPKRRRATV
jgi:hypothetical protein